MSKYMAVSLVEKTITTLGKIEKVNFGFGEHGRVGLSVEFIGWGDFFDDEKNIKKILTDAKVSDISQLKGKPVQAISDGFMLYSWRILTEVL